MNAPVADDEDIGFDQASRSASSAVIDSPGRALHDARRACKLEIVRIANELRLSPETIDAIERDDFEHLPSAVFVSGYIRTYARLLELDPEPLIARFRELHPEAEAPPRVAARASHPAQQPGSGKMPVLLPLVLLVAIAAASYLWWSGNGWISNGTEEPASAEAGADASPFASAPTPELYQPDPANLDPTELENAGTAVVASSSGTSTDDGMGSETTDTSPNAMVQPATGQDTLTPRATAPFAQPEAPEQTEASTTTGIDLLPTVGQDQSEGQDTGALSAATATDPESDPESDSAIIAPQATPEVVATFSGPCWVDIRDAAGQVLLFGEMAAGDRRVLDGDPPYSLVVGNASATELTVGGRPFDLRAIAKGNVARFKLDPAEFDPAEGEATTNGD